MKNIQSSMGAFEAKNKFSEILERVGQGAEITITKHDRPIAKLVSAFSSTKTERKKATLELRSMSKNYSLKGIPIRSLIDEGRR